MDSSRRSVAGTVRSTGTARDDVRNDALRGAALAREKNVNGVGMAAFLNPVDGYRGALERKGIVPTNHAKKNITALREKQREMQQKREEEAEAATKASFKLKKFSSVESRVLSGVTVRQLCSILHVLWCIVSCGWGVEAAAGGVRCWLRVHKAVPEKE